MSNEAFQAHVLSELSKLSDTLHRFDTTMHDFDKKLEVKFTSLPNEFVQRDEFKEQRKDSIKAKRYAMSAIIALVAALGTFVGLFF